MPASCGLLTRSESSHRHLLSEMLANNLASVCYRATPIREATAHVALSGSFWCILHSVPSPASDKRGCVGARGEERILQRLGAYGDGRVSRQPSRRSIVQRTRAACGTWEASMYSCGCQEMHRPQRRIVLTGGPGAGKTAVLELVRQSFCEHMVVLHEAASVVFGGGFPRSDTASHRRAAQRAIFHIQRELEAAVGGHCRCSCALRSWHGGRTCLLARTRGVLGCRRYNALCGVRTICGSHSPDDAVRKRWV